MPTRHPGGPLFLIAALITSIGIGATPSLAQVSAEEPEPGWRVVPYGGSHWLDASDGVTFRGDQSAALQLGEVIGVALDFDTPLTFLGFRVGYERTIGADLIGGSGDAEAAAKGVYIDARLQPVPRSWAVRPYLAIGAERYKVDVEDSRDITFEIHDTTQIASRAGLGVDVDLFAVPLRVEGLMRRYVAEEDDRRSSQQNFALLAGMRIPIR